MTTTKKHSPVHQKRRWIGYGVGIFVALSLFSTSTTLRRMWHGPPFLAIPSLRTNSSSSHFELRIPASVAQKKSVNERPLPQSFNRTNHHRHWILDGDDNHHRQVWHSYEDDRWQTILARYRRRSQRDNDRVLVGVLSSSSSDLSSATPLPLVETVRDCLSSPRALVVVYWHHPYPSPKVVTTTTMAASPPPPPLRRLTREFAESIRKGQLILIMVVKDDDDDDEARVDISSPPEMNAMEASLRDGLALAYLLDLAHQSQLPYTMVVRAGTRLRRNSSRTGESTTEYVSEALQEYRSTVPATPQNETDETRSPPQRACWMDLRSSDSDDNRDLTISSLFETAEHASRMSLTLRSFLPYQKKTVSEILTHYCRHYLWEAKVVQGPGLFSYTPPNIFSNTEEPPNATVPSFLSASDLPLWPPPWIDASVPVGPRSSHHNSASPPYWITFAVTTMTRPIMNNTYLIQFMEELFQLVEDHFHLPPTTNDNGKVSAGAGGVEYSAVIFLLVCGNSVDAIAAHRQFLASTYGDAIARGLIVLQDSPLLSYEHQLQHMHLSYPEDSPQRRYWRSKQNLDVAATWEAVTGLSDYVVMLEDDSGFQPDFVTALQATLRDPSLRNWDGVPVWSMFEYGFGFSGILIHASDLPVFQLMHTVFFDEQPCDLLHTEVMIRKGLSFKKNLLKHYGKISTLEGKVQPVWLLR